MFKLNGRSRAAASHERRESMMLFDQAAFDRRLDALLSEIVVAENVLSHLARIAARRKGEADDADIIHQQAMRLRARRMDLEEMRRPNPP